MYLAGLRPTCMPHSAGMQAAGAAVHLHAAHQSLPAPFVLSGLAWMKPSAAMMPSAAEHVMEAEIGADGQVVVSCGSQQSG